MKIWQVIVFIFILTAIVLLIGCNPYLKPRPQNSYIIDMDGYDVKHGGRWHWIGKRWIWIPLDNRK